MQTDSNGKIAWDAVIKHKSVSSLAALAYQRLQDKTRLEDFESDEKLAKDKLAVWTRPEDSREKWSKPEARLSQKFATLSSDFIYIYIHIQYTMIII